MVTIRLTRRGGKKKPFYHVVVTDSRKRQGGTSLESVGLFNPVARGGGNQVAPGRGSNRALVEQGAHMSDRVKHLLTSVSQTGCIRIKHKVSAMSGESHPALIELGVVGAPLGYEVGSNSAHTRTA